MNYLLDRKLKRKKLSLIFSFILLFIFLFYFRIGIWNGLSSATSFIFRPFLIVGVSVGNKFSNLSSYFISKSSLMTENEKLRLELNESDVRMINYNSILVENESLKEILGRKSEKIEMILANILAKPNQSPYDTLVIDIGLEQNLEVGDMVFAFGNIPIGRVSDVYQSSSKVVLFSSSGEKTNVIVGDIFMEIVGRGGGNFEMVLPRDIVLQKGDPVVLPGITPYMVGIVETIISDPRDSFQKALLVSPVNIQELKFVEVEI